MSAVAYERITKVGASLARRSGAVLFAEGDEARYVYAVVSGRVRIEVSTATGGRVLIAVKGPGEVFGEFGAIDGGPRSAAAVAIEDVELRQVALPTFVEIIRVDPELSISLLRSMSEQLRESADRTAERNSADIATRLARRLDDLVERFGQPGPDGVTIDLALTQDDLAGWIGATREATARALRSLRELGCVTTGRRQITVTDLDALRLVAR